MMLLGTIWYNMSARQISRPLQPRLWSWLRLCYPRAFSWHRMSTCHVHVVHMMHMDSLRQWVISLMHCFHRFHRLRVADHPTTNVSLCDARRSATWYAQPSSSEHSRFVGSAPGSAKLRKTAGTLCLESHSLHGSGAKLLQNHGLNRSKEISMQI